MTKVKIRKITEKSDSGQISIATSELEYAGLKIEDEVWVRAERGGVIKITKVE